MRASWSSGTLRGNVGERVAMGSEFLGSCRSLEKQWAKGVRPIRYRRPVLAVFTPDSKHMTSASVLDPFLHQALSAR
jgi:hypothetical protein